MPTHEFGIMQEAPVKGRRYDKYEPEKYNCISVNDDYIEPILLSLGDIDFYYHTLENSGKGLNYYGITLISPISAEQFADKISAPELSELRTLLLQAKLQNKFIIHFGI